MERDLQLQAEKLRIQPEGSRDKNIQAKVNYTPVDTTKDNSATPDNWDDEEEHHRHDHWEEWEAHRPATGNYARQEKQKLENHSDNDMVW